MGAYIIILSALRILQLPAQVDQQAPRTSLEDLLQLIPNGLRIGSAFDAVEDTVRDGR